MSPLLPSTTCQVRKKWAAIWRPMWGMACPSQRMGFSNNKLTLNLIYICIRLWFDPQVLNLKCSHILFVASSGLTLKCDILSRVGHQSVTLLCWVDPRTYHYMLQRGWLQVILFKIVLPPPPICYIGLALAPICLNRGSPYISSLLLLELWLSTSGDMVRVGL